MNFWPRLAQQLTRHQFTIDLVVVLLALPVVALISSDLFGVPGTGGRPIWWAAAIVAPLAVRRRWPVASAIAVFAVGAAKVLIDPGLAFPADIAILVSLYTVTVYGPRWAGRAAMSGVVLGSCILGVQLLGQFGASGGVQTLMVIITPGVATWGFALLRRARRETLDALRDRADRLERERGQQAQLATAAERARIAREMHDIVAHSLSIVVAQADGGRYAAQQDPAAAARVLETISETGRAALADMRRILGVLRNDEAAGTANGGYQLTPPHPGVPADTAAAAPLTPQPDAEDLGGLLTRVRAAGVRVSLVEVGQARMLPPGMELTIYRIIQEALTNVLKHAGPGPSVTVLRHWRSRTLTIDITDDGRGAAADAPAASTGHGLLGMQERAALFNGTVHATPRDGGGFRVHIELPLPAAAGDTTDAAPIPGTALTDLPDPASAAPPPPEEGLL